MVKGDKSLEELGKVSSFEVSAFLCKLYFISSTGIPWVVTHTHPGDTTVQKQNFNNLHKKSFFNFSSVFWYGIHITIPWSSCPSPTSRAKKIFLGRPLNAKNLVKKSI